MTAKGPRRGGLTIGELRGTRHLELELLAGADGLDRKVSWSTVSELDDPDRWIDAGELLIANGLGFPGDVDAQVKFIQALHGRRAAGFALGMLGPELCPESLQLADELGFPLLRVPAHVPFSSISRLIADLNQENSQWRMATHIRLFDTLQGGCDPVEAPNFIARLEEISGYQLYLIAPSGLPVLSQLSEAPTWIVEQIESYKMVPGGQSCSLPNGHVAPVSLGRRMAGFLVALEREGDEPAGVGAVRHMATIAALLVANVYRERELERRRGAELLGQLLSTSESAQAVALLTGTGLHAGPLCIASLDGHYEAVDELHHRLRDLTLPHLLMGVDEDAYLVMEAVPETLEGLVDDLDLATGVSAAFAPDDHWSLAKNQADRALMRARSESPAGRFCRYETADSPLEWLRPDPHALRELSSKVLRPVIEYDEANGASLMESLRVYLENDRRLSVAADALFVHKHTLAYRLKRIEEITGRVFNRMDDLCVFWLALKTDASGQDLADTSAAVSTRD